MVTLSQRGFTSGFTLLNIIIVEIIGAVCSFTPAGAGTASRALGDVQVGSW